MKEGLTRRELIRTVLASTSASLLLRAISPETASAEPLAPVIVHGDRTISRIALTMDDAWHAGNVEQVLNLCEELELRMTFFPAGRVVKGQAHLWRRALEAGHEVVNHTYTHRWLTHLSSKEVHAEIEAAQAVINDVAGHHVPMKFLRPPGMAGFTRREGDARLRAIIGEHGLAVALWDVDSNSTRYYGRITAKGVYEGVVRFARNGSIVLQHFLPTDVAALPWIVQDLRSRGFELVTMSELLYPKEEEPQDTKEEQRQLVPTPEEY